MEMACGRNYDMPSQLSLGVRYTQATMEGRMAQRGWHLTALAGAAFIFASRAAHACSVIEKPGNPHIGTLAYVRSLIPDAQLVVRARALRYGDGQHYLVPPDATGLGEARAIEFEVLGVLRPDVG